MYCKPGKVYAYLYGFHGVGVVVAGLLGELGDRSLLELVVDGLDVEDFLGLGEHGGDEEGEGVRVKVESAVGAGGAQRVVADE